MLPKEKSMKWFLFFISVFIANFAGLMISRSLIDGSARIKTIIGFAILALLIAIIESIGYFGVRIFSYTFFVVNLFSIIYLFIIILTNKNSGWEDITSVISYIVINGVGIVIGLLVQLFFWTFIKKGNNNNV